MEPKFTQIEFVDCSSTYAGFDGSKEGLYFGDSRISERRMRAVSRPRTIEVSSSEDVETRVDRHFRKKPDLQDANAFTALELRGGNLGSGVAPLYLIQFYRVNP